MPLPSLEDIRYMEMALDQAQQALPVCPPNPAVGCLLLAPPSDSNAAKIIGQGHTQAVGQAHAEIMALRDAAKRGESVHGCTAYVSLEPCAHHGRTPPCSAALIAAGVARVVVAMQDPNPLVAGRGLSQLQAAGIAVTLLPPDSTCANRALDTVRGFVSTMQRQRPWLRLKIAASADGKTALNNGQSQWITAASARADGHAWRARAGAILTGIGTVLADNPQFTVRTQTSTASAQRQPDLLIMDRQLRSPVNAAFWAAGKAVGRRHVIYHQCGAAATGADTARQTHLRALGAELVPFSTLADVLADMAQRGYTEIHIEAGPILNGAWLSSGLVDELLLYLAPTLLGQGRPLAALPEYTALAQGLPMRWLEAQPIGPDLRLRALLG